MFKKLIRVIGIDDSPFRKFKDRRTLIVGVIFRGNSLLEGVIVKNIEVDGDDASSKIIDMVNNTRHKKQLKAILLHGITFAGLNIADIAEINRKTSLPVIAITTKKPDNESFINAIKKTKNSKDKMRRLEKAGKAHAMQISSRSIYLQLSGIDKEDAERIIRITIARGFVPEPIRVAHMIAGAIVRGESKGKA